MRIFMAEERRGFCESRRRLVGNTRRKSKDTYTYYLTKYSSGQKSHRRAVNTRRAATGIGEAALHHSDGARWNHRARRRKLTRLGWLGRRERLVGQRTSAGCDAGCVARQAGRPATRDMQFGISRLARLASRGITRLARPVRIRERAAAEFSPFIEWQRIHDPEIAWHLPGREICPAKLPQIRRAHIADDACHRLLPAQHTRHSEDDHLAHAGNFAQARLTSAGLSLRPATLIKSFTRPVSTNPCGIRSTNSPARNIPAEHARVGLRKVTLADRRPMHLHTPGRDIMDDLRRAPVRPRSLPARAHRWRRTDAPHSLLP